MRACCTCTSGKLERATKIAMMTFPVVVVMILGLLAPIHAVDSRIADAAMSPTLESIHPQQCTVRGGCSLEVTGSAFSTSASAPACRISWSEWGYYFEGQVVTNATVVSTSLLRCLAPASPVGGRVLFEVTMDGHHWSAGGSPWSQTTFTYTAYASAKFARFPYHDEDEGTLLVEFGSTTPSPAIAVVACYLPSESGCAEPSNRTLLRYQVPPRGMHHLTFGLDRFPRGQRLHVRVEFHFNASQPFVSGAILGRTPNLSTGFQAVVQVDSELGMVVAHGAPLVLSGFLLSSLSRGVELARADVCQVGAWGFNAAMLYGAFSADPVDLQTILDRALECGVMVALEMVGPAITASHGPCDPQHPTAPHNTTELWEGIASFLDRVHVHPAVMGYYIGDDTIGDNLTGMVAVREHMWQHDPWHVTIGSIHVTDQARAVVDVPFFENYPSDRGVGSNFSRSLFTAAATQAFPMSFDVVGSTAQAFAGVPLAAMQVINALGVIGGSPHQLWFIYGQGPLISAAATSAAVETRELLPALLRNHRFQRSPGLHGVTCAGEGIHCGAWSDSAGCNALLAVASDPTPTTLTVNISPVPAGSVVVAPFEFNRTIGCVHFEYNARAQCNVTSTPASRGQIVEPMNGHSTRVLMWGRCGQWLPGGDGAFVKDPHNMVQDPTFSFISFPGVGWNELEFVPSNFTSPRIFSVTTDSSRPLLDDTASRVGFYSLRVALGDRWRHAILKVPGASLKNGTVYQIRMSLRSSVPMRINLVCSPADVSKPTNMGLHVLATSSTGLKFTRHSLQNITVAEPCTVGLNQDRPGLWWLDSGMHIGLAGGSKHVNKTV